MIIAAVATYFTFGIAAVYSGSYIIAGAAAGFVGGAITTGTLKGAVIGAISGAITGGIMGHFGTTWNPARVAANGFANGLSSVAQGGKFGNGFFSGVFGGAVSSVSSGINNLNFGAKFIIRSVAGGVSSVLGGGKFKNGARTSAYMVLFSEAADYYKKAVGRRANPLPGENRKGQNDYRFDKYTGRQSPKDESMNVFGFNRKFSPNWIKNIGVQGGFISKTFNLIPTMNATAGLHDFWFNSKSIPENPYTNIGTMLPAAVVSIGASIGNFTQILETNPISNYILTRPYDRNRR